MSSEIHLILIDRDGMMSFACDEVENFTSHGATRDIFRRLLAQGEGTCPYCARIVREHRGASSDRGSVNLRNSRDR